MATMSTPPPFSISRIAIIGAGPAGLAFAKHLLSLRSSHFQIVVFEQSTRVGGVWNYSPQPAPHSSPRMPHTDPLCPPALPNRTDPPEWASPMYEELHSNIPGSLMQYADTPFPESARLFPDREVIREYLERYADEEVRACVRFGWRVDEVRLCGCGRRCEDGDDDCETRERRWDVSVSEVASGKVERATFDAVVVANGHYSIPYVPEIENIMMLDTIHPGLLQHAKTYRTSKAYTNLKVIVVGNGPSGLDIARQINTTARQPVYLSVRHATPPDKLAHTGCVEIPEITRFLPDSRGALLADGTVMTDIDRIVMCTGYMYNYAFLPDLAPSLLKSGKAVHHTYRHLFHTTYPSLVFPGLPTSVVPFPLVEAQAAVVAAVWANKLILPNRAEREKWCEELRAERGEGLDIFEKGEDGRYINELYEWWATGDDGEGKRPPRWSERTLWERSVYAEAKIKFEDAGCKASTLEELGLHYDGDD